MEAMFDRYTEGPRRTLFLARHEAFRLGSPPIEPEHLPGRLIRSSDQRLASSPPRVTREGLRQEIEARSAQSQPRPPLWPRFWDRRRPHDVPFSRQPKLALRHGAAQADRLGHSTIRLGHLLPGILQEPRSVASTMLARQGVRLATVRQSLLGDRQE